MFPSRKFGIRILLVGLVACSMTCFLIAERAEQVRRFNGCCESFQKTLFECWTKTAEENGLNEDPTLFHQIRISTFYSLGSCALSVKGDAYSIKCHCEERSWFFDRPVFHITVGDGMIDGYSRSTIRSKLQDAFQKNDHSFTVTFYDPKSSKKKTE